MADSGKIYLLQPGSNQDITPLVSRFVYKNSLLTGRVQWKLFFKAGNWDFWTNFLIGNGSLFSVRLESSRKGKKSETEWLDLTVDGSRGLIRSTGLRGVIHGGGAEIKMSYKAKRRAFSKTTVSSVIQRIAGEYALVSDVAADVVTSNWYQTNQSDWDFIRELMQYYLPAQNVRGDVYLNIDGRQLTVKPINFSSPATRQYDLTEGDDRVLKAPFRYYGGSVARKGLVVEARGFDRATGLPITFTASPSSTVGFALASKLPQAIADKRTVLVTPHSYTTLVQALAMRTQAQISNRYYGLSLTVLNDLTVKLRDMVELSLQDATGTASFIEGRYGVYEYIFDYSPQSVVTKVIIYRRDSFAGAQAATSSLGGQLANASQTLGGLRHQ